MGYCVGSSGQLYCVEGYCVGSSGQLYCVVGYYVGSSGQFLPTVRDKLSVRSLVVKNQKSVPSQAKVRTGDVDLQFASRGSLAF